MGLLEPHERCGREVRGADLKPLTFYEKVIIAKSDDSPKLVGRSGYVVGISQESGVVYGYAVSFLDEVENYYFKAEDVTGTGEIADRSLFYDDEDPSARIRVRVVDGKGEIVE